MSYRSTTIDGPGVQGTISVGTTAVLLQVGASPLEDRKIVSIQPTGNQVYYGYTSAVTTSTGTRIFKDQLLQLEATDSLEVYLISNNAGGIAVRITEVA